MQVLHHNVHETKQKLRSLVKCPNGQWQRHRNRSLHHTHTMATNDPAVA